ncbi:hypothetical protein ALC56_05638 [Trachymyrmex septentrionalis]|uniref:Uncharacterized protein n=1 Tax=Trachymyrmex septentrionalis TaxID=34720 RepID=A0A195FGQ9_9HYME|nr:hypothetical protein ALC56_05638 [Trachymyrmex septentrionalis]
MAERTLAPDSEKVGEIAPDKTQEVDAILVEMPVVTEDGSKIKKRIRRNIITIPQQNDEIEIKGTRYRYDQNKKLRPVLH